MPATTKERLFMLHAMVKLTEESAAELVCEPTASRLAELLRAAREAIEVEIRNH